MKIYFAASLTQAPKAFADSMAMIRKELAKEFEVLEFYGLGPGDSKDVFHHDMKCVQNCDFLIADCSYPAIGLGFEIAAALRLNKPVLALAQQDALVTRLILGIDDPLYIFTRYRYVSEIPALVSAYSLSKLERDP